MIFGFRRWAERRVNDLVKAEVIRRRLEHDDALEQAALLIEKFPTSVLHLWGHAAPGNYYRPTTRADLAAAVRELKRKS